MRWSGVRGRVRVRVRVRVTIFRSHRRHAGVVRACVACVRACACACERKQGEIEGRGERERESEKENAFERFTVKSTFEFEVGLFIQPRKLR